jgi:hypothetical protein
MIVDSEPIITKSNGGQYSTIIRPDKYVETIWFETPTSVGVVVGMTSIRALAIKHVHAHQG